MAEVNREVIKLFINTKENFPSIKSLLKEDTAKIYELLEDLHDKNLLVYSCEDKEQDYKNNLSGLEKDNKELKEGYLSEISEVVQQIEMEMNNYGWNPFKWFNRNTNRHTEKYYNWLLPYLSEIDRYIIPGFQRSWNSYRHDFEGMLGLVRALNKVRKNFNIR